MRNLLINTCFGAAVLVAGAATANEELIKMSQNPKDWVMPTGELRNRLALLSKNLAGYRLWLHGPR
jgi:hypothetical protein